MIRSSSCPPWPHDPTSDPTEDRRSYTTPGGTTVLGSGRRGSATTRPSSPLVARLRGIEVGAPLERQLEAPRGEHHALAGDLADERPDAGLEVSGVFRSHANRPRLSAFTGSSARIGARGHIRSCPRSAATSPPTGIVGGRPFRPTLGQFASGMSKTKHLCGVFCRSNTLAWPLRQSDDASRSTCGCRARETRRRWSDEPSMR